MPSGDASGRIISLYTRFGAAWSRSRGRSSFFEKPWIGKFLAAAENRNAPIYDFGCGDGWPIADHMAGEGRRVVGLDGSPSLIRIAKSRARAGNWLVGDMRAPPLRPTAGGVLAWHSFFHLTADDQRAVLALFGELTTRGAALMFTSGTEEGEAIGSFEGEPLYHASLDVAEYEERLAAAGFDIIALSRDTADCGGATIWLARRN